MCWDIIIHLKWLPHLPSWCRRTHESSSSWSRASESCRATEVQQKSEGDIKVNPNHMAPNLQMNRLFHSPLAVPWGQAICLSSGLCKETDYQWPFKNGGNSHWSFEPIIHCKLSWIQWSWSVFKWPITKLAKTDNWRLCLIPRWESISHQARLCNSLSNEPPGCCRELHCSQCITGNTWNWGYLENVVKIHKK